MRLIDADELIEHMFLGTEYDKTVDDGMEKTEAMCKAFKCGWNDALASVIDYAPTVDAVPLEDYKSMGRTVNKLTKAFADAEPVKHGHWKPSEYGDYHWHECSVCKVADYYITDVTRFNGTVDTLMFRREYCPHCGAKMDEVEE